MIYPEMVEAKGYPTQQRQGQGITITIGKMDFQSPGGVGTG
jgi:hypothetical protein